MNLLEGGNGEEGRMGERGWGGDGREGGGGDVGREGGWGEREGGERGRETTLHFPPCGGVSPRRYRTWPNSLSQPPSTADLNPSKHNVYRHRPSGGKTKYCL